MERNRMVIELDFSECTYYSEIYQEIKQKFHLPEECGNNLDALWDAVTGMMYTPAQITVKNRNPKNAELASTVTQVLDVLREAQAEYGEIVLIEA